ncbi:MAG: OmpA family protein [Desulfovibrionaceae bacterium]
MKHIPCLLAAACTLLLLFAFLGGIACAENRVDMSNATPSTEALIRALTPPAQPETGTPATTPRTRGIPPAGGTRGFSVTGTPTVPATGTPPTPTVTGTAVQADTAPARPTVALKVEFAYDSDALTPQAVAVLEALGAALTSKALSAYRFRIEGHTDAVGGAAYNLDLSRRRAAAVARHLAATYAMPPARMEVVGMGEEQPLPGMPPEDGRNRRVEVINLGNGP